MALRILGWAEHAREAPLNHQSLIAWKLPQFHAVGWGGTSAKWGGTATIDKPLSDFEVPVGCVAFEGTEIAGMAFLVDGDLPNYPVNLDQVLAVPFTGQDPVQGEVAGPWLSGMVVDSRFRSGVKIGDTRDGANPGVGRQLEQFI